MGVDMRVFARGKRVKADEGGGNRYAPFSDPSDVPLLLSQASFFVSPFLRRTGSSSSIDFKGSNIQLLPRNDCHDVADEPLAWRESGQGDCMKVLAWDVSRTTVVPFK